MEKCENCKFWKLAPRKKEKDSVGGMHRSLKFSDRRFLFGQPRGWLRNVVIGAVNTSQNNSDHRDEYDYSHN